jgi:hypothetical protein
MKIDKKSLMLAAALTCLMVATIAWLTAASASSASNLVLAGEIAALIDDEMTQDDKAGDRKMDDKRQIKPDKKERKADQKRPESKPAIY